MVNYIMNQSCDKIRVVDVVHVGQATGPKPCKFIRFSTCKIGNRTFVTKYRN